MNSVEIESVCIFGSAARKSNDQMSDKDVLIVSNDCFRRQHMVEYWTKSGWSVASYSPSRLLKMIDAGSLFIQHLKFEGILLRDQHGWLERALQSAEKKNTYEADAKESVSLALPIERFASDALIQQNPIVSDLAYVALRNFGICYLADKGEMVFDYHTIVEKISRDFGLSATEIKLAHSLRKGKSAYRSSGSYDEISNTVEELRFVLSKFFQHRPLKNIQYGTPVRDLRSGYATLRDFEAAVVHTIDKEFDDTGIVGSNGLDHVLKLVRDPRTYAWDVRNLSQGVLESIRLNLESPKYQNPEFAVTSTNWLSSMSV